MGNTSGWSAVPFFKSSYMPTPRSVPSLLRVTFLGFIVSSQGVSTDPDKIKAILEWPEPRTLRKVCSFHGLAIFYRRFIQGLSTIITPMTYCIRKGDFVWTKAALKVFHELKKNMTEAPVLQLPNFSKAFEVVCDASGVGICGVLSQKGLSIAFFSEKTQ